MNRLTTIGISSVLLTAQMIFSTTYKASSWNDIVTNVTKLTAGDTLIVAAGTYKAPKADSSQSIRLKQSGEKGKRIFFGTVGNDKAILDFGFGYKTTDIQSTAQGICLYGNYWYIRGLSITGAGDNGMLIEMASPYPTTAPSTPTGGSYNIIDCCAFYENNDAGLQLKNFASFDTILNCDAYHNYDTDDQGGDADGFAPKQNCGPGLYFFGCRSWVNSDDGWDAYHKSNKTQWGSRITITTDYCICYKNGYEKNESTTTSKMNGNGFKMGSDEYAVNFVCLHSLSVNNKAKGFDANNNTGEMKMFNCSAYKNGKSDYAFASGKSTITNCNAVGSAPAGDEGSNNAGGAETDFQNMTVANLVLDRNTDGSLNDKTLQFMAPKTGDTKFIDKGTSVSGYEIHAQGKPDIGWIENGYPNAIYNYPKVKINNILKESLKAGNFLNSITYLSTNRITIGYTVFSNGTLDAALYDVSGKQIVNLGKSKILSGSHEHCVDISRLSKGNYICTMKFNSSEGVIEGFAKFVKN